MPEAGRAGGGEAGGGEAAGGEVGGGEAGATPAAAGPRPIRDVARAVLGRLGETAVPLDDLAFGRVVSFRGFGGRRAGEAVLEGRDGPVAGSLLGGLARRQIEDARAGALVEVPVGDTDAVAAGLACGGVATVLVTPAAGVSRAVWEALGADLRVGLATLTGPGGAMTTLALTEDPAAKSFRRHGSLGDTELDSQAEARLSAALRGGHDATELATIGERPMVLECYVPTTTLVVVGAAVLADALAAQARLLGWQADVRAGFADEEANLVGSLGRSDAVVVLSHDPAVDTLALDAALSSGCYVGALGSRHTQTARRERLRALGRSDGDLGRIHGPVGLDLGSRTPEETAVAIVAEILAHRSGRDPASLRTTTGPING